MRLTHLSLTNFRNFARLDVEVPRGPLLLVGDNAQGKTSLLEAVYFLATFVSFHATNDRQLINLYATREPVAVARIVATFDRALNPEQTARTKSHRLEVRIVVEENAANGSARAHKEILLDGAKRKVNETIGAFNAVLFLPQMLRIIEGSPDDRRRYLNLAMAQVLPNYAQTLADYNQMLSQRNALLKQLSERGSDLASSAGLLAFWDEQIARTGAEIMYARIQALKEIERLAARLHSELTHGQEVLRMNYLPSFEPLPINSSQLAFKLEAQIDRSGLPLEKIQNSFFEHLGRVRAEELARGVTTIGPHRDEIRFLANQVDLGTYGSRGQARTAVLALKLSEVAWIRERSGEWPVLLLDEVLAELDPQRRIDLISRLLEIEQAIMSTTDVELFSGEFIRAASTWRVQAGQIIKEEKHEH